MVETVVDSTNVALVAKRLEVHLRSRGLHEGDRYMTVSDAAVMLGVSRATAHRAIGRLVQRGLLYGQHGRGTFVGKGIGPQKSAVRIRTVYVLIPAEQIGVSGVQLDVMIQAIRKHCGVVDVQFSFVPATDDLEYVRELVEAAQKMGVYAGAIPISCSRSVYKYLAGAGGPIVVLGSVYDDQKDIPSVDVDYRQTGYLLAQHLVGRGHRRMALLSTGAGRPGDNAFFDGVSDALTEAKLPHNSLLVRIYPSDFDAFRVQVREMLRREDRPTAVICGSPPFTGTVESVAMELGIQIPEELELVFESQSTPDAARLPYVHVQPQLSFESIASIVARMLKEGGDSGNVANPRVLIPVELRCP